MEVQKRPRGKPRGCAPRQIALDTALRQRGMDGLGITVAALITKQYPVPTSWSAIAQALTELTGIPVGRREVHDWVRAAWRRIGEAGAAPVE